jgi:hypothetical protein
VLPHVPWPRASSPCRVKLQRCHVFLSSGPRLPAEVGSGPATCSSALDLASLPRWAPALPRGPGLAYSRGELWRCHVPHSPQWAVDHRNKEGPSCPRHAAGLACVQSTVMCYRGAYKACGQAATVRFNRAMHAQLTTSGHEYSGDTTRQDGTTALTMFSVAGSGDWMTPCC